MAELEAGPDAARVRRGDAIRRAAAAALASALAFVAADRLGLVTVLGLRRLLDVEDAWLFWVAAVLSALLAGTRFALLPWLLSGAVLVLYALVAFTPVFCPAIHAWALDEPLGRADAIVVLSADVTEDGHLSANGLGRFVHGLMLARQGWAPLLVRTDLSPPRPDDTDDVRRLAEGSGVEIALVGPVASTRDEALAVAAFARERALRSVIVVTQPLHERRAAATFRATGLRVLACAAPERNYSLGALATPGDRVAAFRDWITELAAWALYASRGWLGERERT